MTAVPLTRCVLAGLALAIGQGIVHAQAFNFPAPSAAQLGTKLDVWATHYHVYPAKHLPGGVDMIDAKGNALGVSLLEKDWCLGGIEGTFLIEMPDGASRTFNVADAKGPQQADCAKYFTKPPAWVSFRPRAKAANTWVGRGAVQGRRVRFPQGKALQEVSFTRWCSPPRCKLASRP